MTYPGHPYHFSSEIEKVQLDVLNVTELDELSNDLSRHVNTDANQRALADRNLHHVVEQHSNPRDSHDIVMLARDMTAEGRMVASAIRSSTTGEWLGACVVERERRLRRPSHSLAGLLPTQVTRRVSFLSEPVVTEGPRVAAWLDSSHQSFANMTEVYGSLKEQGGEGSWTLEPANQRHTAVSRAIAAVMRPADLDRFDDLQVLAQGIPPQSILYVNRPHSGGEEVG